MRKFIKFARIFSVLCLMFVPSVSLGAPAGEDTFQIHISFGRDGEYYWIDPRFAFQICAQGYYEVDWGDGGNEWAELGSASECREFSHSYMDAQNRVVTIRGDSFEYGDNPTFQIIQGQHLVTRLSGVMGAVFPTLNGGDNEYDQPLFTNAFENCKNLRYVSEYLFGGPGFGFMRGRPRQNMFYRTFANCYQLTGFVPDKLFSDFNNFGVGSVDGFVDTFAGCGQMTRSCPDGAPMLYNPDPSWDDVVAVCGAPGIGSFGDAGSADMYVDAEFPFAVSVRIGDISWLEQPVSMEQERMVGIYICADGDVEIDWGDGTHHVKQGGEGCEDPIMHEYGGVGEYIIRLGNSSINNYYGDNCGYGGWCGDRSTIRFYNADRKILKMYGSIGAVFPTLNNGDMTEEQPSFRMAFANLFNLTRVPERLFSGIFGRPRQYMFYRTFANNVSLAGFVPYQLLENMNDIGTQQMPEYEDMFWGNSRMAAYCPMGTVVSAPYDNRQAGFCNTPGEGSFSYDADVLPVDDLFVDNYTNAQFPFAMEFEMDDFDFRDRGNNVYVDMQICADGVIEIDWGDGSDTESVAADVNCVPVYHGYNIQHFVIRMGNRGIWQYREYHDEWMRRATINFNDEIRANVTKLYGSLGAVFPTLNDAKKVTEQPLFLETFMDFKKLMLVSSNLFSGIRGYARPRMFERTFANCRGLTGYVPGQFLKEKLFYSGDFFGTSSGTEFWEMFENTGLDSRCYEPLYDISWGTGRTNVAWCKGDGNGSFVKFKYPDIPGQTHCGYDEVFNITTNSCENGWGEYDGQFVVHVANTDEFRFSLNAAGKFTVDWGDGSIQTIERNPGDWPETFTHNYAKPWSYAVGFKGLATDYTRGDDSPVIGFGGMYLSPYNDMWGEVYSNPVLSVSGSLGSVFSTVKDQQPSFTNLFEDCVSLGYISPILFSEVLNGECWGVCGQPGDSMFKYAFLNCKRLQYVPDKLFAGISGTPTEGIFKNAFSGCSRLQEIPENLFSGISGDPAYGMFAGTFSYCSSLKSLPVGLFQGIAGPAQGSMYDSTFLGCTGLQGYVPYEMFSGIRGIGRESYIDGFNDIFTDTPQMDTTCPDEMVNVTKPSSTWGAAAFCRNFACPDGYDYNADAATESECQIMCPAGSWVATAGGVCADVGNAYYSTGEPVNWGTVGGRAECPEGLSTVGFGLAADEADDCGKVLHMGEYTLRLRSGEPITHPALHVRISPTLVLNADMEPAESNVARGHLRTQIGDTVYWIYNHEVDLPRPAITVLGDGH